MAQVDLSEWADELGSNMPGLTEGAARQALRAAFREFCTVSGAWVRELEPISIIADQTEYDLNAAIDDAEVLYVLGVYYRPQQNDPNSTAARFLSPVQSPQHAGRVSQPSAQPWGYTGNSEEPSKITLVPGVNQNIDDSLLPYVALGPKYPFVDKFPMICKTHFFEILLDGATGRLMGQQDKPYTNIMTAQYHLRRFRIGMASARDAARKQFTSAESSFAFPYWAGGTARKQGW